MGEGKGSRWANYGKIVHGRFEPDFDFRFGGGVG